MKTHLGFLIALALISIHTWAADHTAIVQTPRGTNIHLDFYNFGTVDRVLLVAPGGACDPRLDLYEEVARAAKPKQTMIVRLHWAYCVADPDKGRPSESLKDEDEDLRTALSFLVKWMNIDEKEIILGGKSLGSIVGHKVFKERADLKGFLVMTPVCTRNDKNVFDVYYPGLEQETRPVGMIKGDSDPLCTSAHWSEFLADRGQNFQAKLVPGDHGFRIFNKDGKLDEEQTRQNLVSVAAWIAEIGH